MRRITIRRFVQEEEKIQWLIEGLLPSVGWTFLIGKQGLGKSTFAMQICSALQDGKDFLGRKTKQTNIVFIQADSPTVEWREMLRRIAPESTGWTIIDVPAKCLDSPSYVQQIASAIERIKPGFIVFDSLYNLTGGKINSEQVLVPINMMKTIAVVDDIQIPWLLIHHPPHGETRAAGHHSASANCSNEWHLLKTKLVIAKGRLVKDKEILLTRNEKGLWLVRERTVRADSILDMEI